MKRYQFSRIIVSIAVFTLLSFSFLFFSLKGDRLTLSSLSDFTKDVTALFTSTISKPTYFLSSKKDTIRDLLFSYSENKQLKKSISDLENLVQVNQSLKAENESLRNDLLIQNEYTDNTLIHSMVSVRTPNAWNQELILDSGSKQGISKNMLIVSNGGLVGTIESVSKFSTTVHLLSNSNNFTKLPVKLSVGEVSIYGILSGYDIDSHSLVVTQLNSDVEIPSDTLVVTSDLAGDTPANVPIGKVVLVKTNSSSLNRELFISPLADFSNLYSVTVIG